MRWQRRTNVWRGVTSPATKKRNRSRTGYAAHSGERRHKPVSPVSAKLHKLALWTYTLACAPGGYAVSEQVRTAGPDGGEQRPSGGKIRKGLVIGIVGGFLTAGAVVLALNGGPPFIKKDATLSLVAPQRLLTRRGPSILHPPNSWQAARRNAPYHLLRWQSGRPPVPRVELLGYAPAVISRLPSP